VATARAVALRRDFKVHALRFGERNTDKAKPPCFDFLSAGHLVIYWRA
jgi:hypothetical protein